MELNYTEKNVTKGEERKNTSLSEAHTGKKYLMAFHCFRHGF